MSRRFRSAEARRVAEPDSAILSQNRRSYQSGPAMRYLFRPLLMAALITAGASGVAAIFAAVSEDPRWTAVLLLLFLVALEAIYTTNWLQQPGQLALDRTAYRAAELVLLIVVVRAGTWLIFDQSWPDRELLLEYLSNPGRLILDPTFLIVLATAIIGWRLGVMLSQLFHELEISEFELRYYSLPPVERKQHADDQPIRLGRGAQVNAFARTWLWGGIFLAVTTGISLLEGRSLEQTLLAPLAAGGTDIPPSLLAALLAYFLIGLWLLSQARLMEMDARWLLNGIQKDVEMRRTWQRTSLLILLGIAVIAAFLPIGSTSALSQIVATILFGVLFIANILIFLITLPFALILALLPGGEGVTTPPPPPLSPQSLIEQQQQEIIPLSETVTLVLSSAFWTLLIAGIVIALLFFLRERRRRAEGERVDQLWAQFRAWLAALWLGWRGRMAIWQQPSSAAVGQADTPPARGGWRERLRRFTGLTPREQVRYFYLLAVRRAAEEGVTRQPAETPIEFADDVHETWPEADAPLHDLTEAFLKARYSNQPVDPEDVPQARESWQTLRRASRKRDTRAEDKQDDGPEPDA